jgi:succinyl-diaminopimelate desuccinylase
MYGGLLPSAPRLLIEAVRSIVGPDGALTVDGVDERVQTNNPELLDMLGRIPWNEADIRASLGVSDFAGGMTGLPLLRRYILEPFVAVCSFSSGDPAWGLVIPGDATARLDVRLVPGLDPDDVIHLIREQLKARGFGDVTLTVLAAVAPDRIGPSEPIVVAAQQAAWDTEGKAPVVYPLMPAYSASRVFRNGLGTPVLFAGAPTNATSDLHAANENIVVDELYAYVRFVGRLIAKFAAVS